MAKNTIAKRKSARKQARPARTPRAKQPKRPNAKKVSISKCVQDYALARVDPFNPGATGACMPGNVSVPSFKYMNENQLEMGAPAGEYLYILWLPDASNNSATLWYLASAFGPTGITIGTIQGSGSTVQGYGSPFTGASFTHGNLDQRLVGGAVRVRTTEPALSVSGSIWGYNTPSGSSLLGASNVSVYEAFYNTRRAIKANTRTKPFSLIYDYDNELAAQSWTDSSAAVHGLTVPLGVIVVPPSATGATTVLVDFRQHWEVRGRTVASYATPNPSDPGMFSKAFSTIADVLRTSGRTVVQGAQAYRQVMSVLQGGGYYLNPNTRTMAWYEDII